MKQNEDGMVAFARQALELVHKTHLTLDESDALGRTTIDYWRKHVNSGFLLYRKTMGDGEGQASLDWSDCYGGSAWFTDARGTAFLDFLSGFGIFNVGHRHPTVVQAVHAQLMKQPMHSQEFLDPLRAYAAKLLSLLMPGPLLTHSFFVNSGTEAVEAALKMAMLHTGRHRIIACVNAFHGKTLGSLAATSKATFRGPFLHALAPALHVPFNDSDALAKAFESADFTGTPIAAFIVEPVQGEGGVHVATAEFLEAARRLCTAHGACLIFDEVQCGFGRTGKWFACQHSGVVPDLMCIGKSAGGGVMPVAACCGTEEIWKKYINNPFLLTSTFGGNPLAMAALIATVNVISDGKLLDAAATRGLQLRAGLQALAGSYPDIIKEIRGIGLMLAVEFVSNNIGITWCRNCLQRRIVVAGTLISASTVRVCPPLVISSQEITYALREMEAACQNARREEKTVSLAKL